MLTDVEEYYKSVLGIEDEKQNDIVPLTPEAIIERVCRITKVPVDFVMGGNRKEDTVNARIMISEIIRVKFPKMSLSKIGKYMNKDHSMVIHYLEKFSWYYNKEEKFTNTFDKIERSLHRSEDYLFS